MNFELRGSSPKIIQEREIVVCGVVVGTVSEQDRRGYSRFHVVIKVQGAIGFASGLAQGFGDTVDDAIAEAFVSSKGRAEAYLVALEQLRLKMLAAGEDNK